MANGRSLRLSPGERAFRVANLTILIGFCALILYPFLNLIAVSFSDSFAVLRSEVTFYPIGFTADAYRQVVVNPHIIRAYANTIFVAVVGCVLSLVLTSMAAYPLAFSDFIGKKAYNIFITLTLWFSGGIIPTFLVVKNLGLVDSLFSLILTSLVGAYNVIILRSFFAGLPASMAESARIDGAGDFTILFRIVVPLSKAALSTIALWVIVAHWNNYMAPLMYLRSSDKYTLQMVLRDIVIASESNLYEIESASTKIEGGVTAISDQVKNAVLMFSMIPMLVIYPFIQRYFVTGVTLGAVKE
jgi:ABC-type sugar transport system, permease component